MTYSFKKKQSRSFARLLCVVLTMLLMTTAFAGCSKKNSDPTDSTPLPTPGLLESDPTTPSESEPTVPSETEPEKKNVAIVKQQVSIRSWPSNEGNILGQL